MITDVSKVKINNTNYDIKDSTAWNTLVNKKKQLITMPIQEV